jgi:hypothetical protein
MKDELEILFASTFHHSGESRNPVFSVMAVREPPLPWTPAFAGVTTF